MGLWRKFCADCVDLLPSSADITHKFHSIVWRTEQDKNTLTKEQLIRRLHHSRGLCAYCGQFIGIKSLVLDHIHPVCKGGAATVENLAAACAVCNRAKWKEEWPAPTQMAILDQASLMARIDGLLTECRWYKTKDQTLYESGGIMIDASDLNHVAALLQTGGLRVWDESPDWIDVYSR